MTTVPVPIIGETDGDKVTFYCPKCKKPRPSVRHPMTELCGECHKKLEEEIKQPTLI